MVIEAPHRGQGRSHSAGFGLRCWFYFDSCSRLLCLRWSLIQSLKPAASARVMSAAGALWQAVAFCPLHSGEKSVRPAFSAAARSGAMALVASGKAGAARLSPVAKCVLPLPPISRITRLTMPRAGRPVKTLVSVV